MSDEITNTNSIEEKTVEQPVTEVVPVSDTAPVDLTTEKASQPILEVNNSEIRAEEVPIIKEEPLIAQKVEKPTLVENTTVQTQIKPENEVLKPVETTNLGNSSPSIPLIPIPVIDPITSIFKANMARARELLVKARLAVQIKKKQKLEKIMTLFTKKEKIKNHDVRDLLHTSDSTATAYLNILEKDGKIKQNGQIGGGIYYTKVILD